MIVFSVAFGEPYIKRLFERCLPSLFGADRRPNSPPEEKLTLLITTLTEDFDLVERYTQTPIADIFHESGGIQIVHSPTKIDPAAGLTPLLISSGLLIEALKVLAKSDEIFLAAFPDLIASRGLVENCYMLHRATGKNIAIFNGRVAETDSEDFSTEALLRTSANPRATIDFFYKNMSPSWRANHTTDYTKIIGAYEGHMILKSNGKLLVFGPSPNPVLGRFLESDLEIFARDASAIKRWDHRWRDVMLASKRLLVQTNLDAGMSIEPEQPPLMPFFIPPEVTTQQKFGNEHCFCFTTSYVD